MVFVGMLLGSLIFGDISDRFGRHKAISIGIVGNLIFGVTTAYMTSYWSIVLLRTLSMTCSYGIGLSCFVLMLELFGPSARSTMGVLIGLSFAGGIMIFGVTAYYIRPWVWLQLAGSLPLAIFLVYYFAIPESPRWLLTRGKLIRFKSIIFDVAATNKAVIPPTFIDELVKGVLESRESGPKRETVSILSIVRRPNMLWKTSILCYCWFVVNMVYYGITMNLATLPGSPFWKLVISGAVEFPANFVILVLMMFLGRRILICSTFVFGGICCALCSCVPGDFLVNLLAQCGKFFISATFTMAYIFSGEMFPTPVRTIGVGLCSFHARVGGIVGSFIIQYAVDHHAPVLPLLIFGILAIVAGVLVMLLPETRNRKLPETLEEAEAFGRPPCCRKGAQRFPVRDLVVTEPDDMRQSLLNELDSDEEKVL